jgi:peptidoglycan/xylan/chitin deacetylase (PgdA/CDA1 family)
LNSIIRSISPKGLYWSVPTDKKTIYLTFDDGPTRELTLSILKILREFEAKATFFCVGANIEKHNDLFEEIKLRGHALGNHTYHHVKGWKTPAKVYLEDITKCDNLVDSGLFRPPYGKITFRQIRMVRKDYRIIMWNVLTRDYDQRIDFKDCLIRSIQQTSPGSIIVFHDNIKASRNMLYTLPRYLEHLKKQEFVFDRLSSELFHY